MKKKTRRIIEICILILLLGYLVLFLIDYNRSKNSKRPLIIINTKEKSYDDGFVKEYYSLGWVYREYRRETITDNEIAPFWSRIRLNDVLNRENEENLPELEDYSIPNNPYKATKLDDILFFYDKDENLLGTYKCINSEKDCDVAKNTNLDLDEETYYNYPMNIIEDRYIFIEDYRSKNTPVEEAIVYLFDMKAKRVIAKYEGVRYTTLQDDKGLIDNSKYIVKKNGKWGIDQVILGKVTNKIAFNYDYIKYDLNTKLYILKDSANNWQSLNVETNEYSTPFTRPITATYKNGNTYLIGINTYDKENYKTNYELYNLDGSSVINKENIDYLYVYNNYIAYANDSELRIINYEGTELITPLKLYFNNFKETSYSAMSFYVEEIDNEVKITIPQKNSNDRMQNEYFYNKDTWELTRTHLDVYQST